MDAQTTQCTTAPATSASSVNGVPEQPWYAAYPKARSEPKSITRQEVLQLLKRDTSPVKNFVIVDLRRSDYEASTPYPPAQTRAMDQLNVKISCSS